MWFKNISLNWFMIVWVLFLSLYVFESRAHDWMAPPEAAKKNNPVAASQDSVDRGKDVYLMSCASCHGEKLEGLEAEAVGLATNTPDLKKRLKTHSDGDFFWKIQNGKGDMPSFQEDLSETQIWDVINYIRSETE